MASGGGFSISGKRLFGAVRVDPPVEILANKLCAVLSRAKPHDLVDVMAFDSAGFDIEEAIALASRKDAGLTPAQLAWILSTVEIDDSAGLPGSTSPNSLRSFVADLAARLARMAFPG